MKKYLWFALLLFGMLLTSCSDKSNHITNVPTPNEQTGILRINNHSAARIEVTFSDGTTSIEPSGSNSRSFNIDEPAYVSYQVEGFYVSTHTINSLIKEENTTVVDVESDCGRVKITNTTSASMTCTIAGNSVQLSPAQWTEMKVPIGTADSLSVLMDVICSYIQENTIPVMITKNRTTSKVLAPNAGILEFKNNTNASVYLTIAGTGYVIDSKCTQDIKSYNPNEFGSIVYHLVGDYVMGRDDNASFYIDETYHVNITADAACVKFYNATSADVKVTFQSNDYWIASNAFQKVSYHVDDQLAHLVSYHNEGLYLWTEDRHMYIQQNQTNTVNIGANCGALTVINNSGLTIDEVYLFPADVTSFCYDMSLHLHPGQSRTVHANPGSWDMKIAMENGVDHMLPDQQITVNNTLTVDFTGRKLQKVIGNRY